MRSRKLQELPDALCSPAVGLRCWSLRVSRHNGCPIVRSSADAGVQGYLRTPMYVSATMAQGHAAALAQEKIDGVHADLSKHVPLTCSLCNRCNGSPAALSGNASSTHCTEQMHTYPRRKVRVCTDCTSAQATTMLHLPMASATAPKSSAGKAAPPNSLCSIA